MLSTIFPIEIIEHIMSYWGGHRLGLTCSHLRERLSADNYVTTRIAHDDIDDHDIQNDALEMSALPNGLFHGVVHVIDSLPEKITYHHGNIIRREICEGDIAPTICKIIRGRVFSWCLGDVMLGDVFSTESDFDNIDDVGCCDVEQFESRALEYLEGKPDGTVNTLTVRNCWFCHMLPPGVGRIM